MNTTDCLMCKAPFLSKENDNGRYSLQDCGLSPAQFEGQDGFLCHSCKSKQMQETRRASNKRPSSCPLEHPECLKCKTPFQKAPKGGYQRRSLKAMKISPEQFGGQDGFVCYKCRRILMKQQARIPKKKPKRKRLVNPRPKRKRSCNPRPKKKSENTRPHHETLKELLLNRMKDCQYGPMVRLLLRMESARKAYQLFLDKAVRKEIKAYPKTHLAHAVTAEQVASFKWVEVIEEATSCMPILVNVLKAALPDPSHRKGNVFCGRGVRSTKQAQGIYNQRLGFILSLIMYSHNPQVYSFIQGCVSLQLWKHGCSQKVVESLHALGICKGLKGTAKTASKLKKDPAQKQKQWQRALSEQLKASAAAVEDSETHKPSLCNRVQAGVLKSPVVEDMDDDVSSDMSVHVSADSNSDSDVVSSHEGQEIRVDRKTHKPAPCNEVQAGVLNSPATDGMDDDAASEMNVSSENNSDSDAVPSPLAQLSLHVTAVNVDNLPSTSSGKHGSFFEDTSHKRKYQAPIHTLPLHLRRKPEPGYTIVCDNVLMQSAKRSNELKLQAAIFAVRNRVGFDQQMAYTMKHAEDIPLSCFLPTFSDWRNLKQRMCQILQHILKDHLPFLKGVTCSAPKRHLHSDALSKKSEIVSLGVIDENPFSTQGSVCMLESLHRFVPSYGEDLYPTACFGDGLSVAQMTDAKQTRVSGASAADRLEGLVQCPQDFHRRGVLLQDTMDRFFKEESATDRGTLFQLKQEFGHQSVKRNVMENFNHVEDLIQFCTRAFSIMLALKLIQEEDIPEPFPSSGAASHQKVWLTKFIWKIVDFVWPEIPSEDMNKACEQQGAGATLGFNGHNGDVENAINDDACKCGESTGEGMIRCSNRECGWFHYSCAYVHGPVEGDWWCSAECQASKSSLYCKCHKKTEKEEVMIQCELQRHCSFNEWYHLECVGGAEDFPDEWYCSPECEQRGLDKSASDGVQEYSRALLFEGLCHLAFRDAVWEGDGPAILSHWRINTLQFWNNSHLKYFNLAHNMLAGVNGFYPARVAHDMTWNRVANLTGQADHNIGLDLVKEIPTEDYQEMLSQVQGVNPKHQGEHSSKLSETLCRDLDDIFLQSRFGIQKQRSEQARQKFDQDVQCFAASYTDDGLFDFVPGRHHKCFPFFKHSLDVKSPHIMGKKLLQLSKLMDMGRESVQSWSAAHT
ncbi:uncharacterized protein LOC119720481 [Patiria miniata]|uniref:Zinc finger PHD-type domain-containing protein n=1 Tax=Patiria miniata TaxID=46514 RepID=A0A913Z2M9_PATMI|nr:uncharacterized protein LOC119720481 [Patiria miniata]XP_038046084.1 uncharacterized protein LOC119720481 [Patiria miniata]